MSMLRVFLLLAVALLFSVPAQAEYPDKPITVYCQWGPGGSADLGLRVLAEYATKHGVPMNVVNKTAGSGSQGGMEVLKARPDGYLFLFAGGSLHILSLVKNVGFKLTDDFTPVADLIDMPLTFCVRSDSGIKSFDEWIELAKQNPGKYNYGSPTALSPQRFFMSNLLKDKFPGVDAPHVPFSSGHESNTALLGGHTKATFGVPGTNKSYLNSGDFTLLGVTSDERLKEWPDAPTFKEKYGDDYVMASYHGLFAHPKTPKPIVEKVSKLMDDALKDPEVIAKFEKIGIIPSYKNPEDFKTLIQKFDKQVKSGLESVNQQ